MTREKLSFWKQSLLTFIVGFVVDHATKFWAEFALKPVGFSAIHAPAPGTKIPVITIIPHCLELLYAENTGAAFSMLSSSTGVLAIISIVASIALVWYWTTLPTQEKWGRFAVALILSGAVGNLVDRVFRGFVIDFVHAYFRQWSWPVFNVADSCICVGAGILAVRFLKNKI
ncbi:signal peptidase II [Candidatus Sumerlaeota bacterium]|nr:signal peptidase II [Candidatus Sumerlaeota bacterium]